MFPSEETILVRELFIISEVWSNEKSPIHPPTQWRGPQPLGGSLPSIFASH